MKRRSLLAAFVASITLISLGLQAQYPVPELTSGLRTPLGISLRCAPGGLTGFSYNLRIGTTPGGVDILSPEADLDTGWRRVTALGNLGENLSANFRLPPGKYYWSVQAVDSGFVGSTFASEQEFNINLLINTKDVR